MTTHTFHISHYDLDATMDSGQVFRWRRQSDGSWCGVVETRWVSLTSKPGCIIATTAEPVSDWIWLEKFLQTDVDLAGVLAGFPDDDPMRAAVAACHGLRLLRQDPWECLASFLVSSTKQIVQIRQVLTTLCERHGEAVPMPPGFAPAFAFPSAPRVASLGEDSLRACKMGFRAPFMLEAARRVAEGRINLAALSGVSMEEARARLMELPGVGPKIADCVLLFSCGFDRAFPVDVWVARALRQLYFPRRRPTMRRVQRFIQDHFGPRAGWAQQYLFHYMRIHRASNGGRS